MQQQRVVIYNDENHGQFAQYCKRQAGYYPGMRKWRRKLEIAAHAAGVRQRETYEGASKKASLAAKLDWFNN